MTGEEVLEWLEQRASRLEMLDYYQVLGCSPTADYYTINQIYQERSQAIHPDRFAMRPGLQQWAMPARSVFVRLHEAYRVLGDPLVRPRYDAARNEGLLRFDAQWLEQISATEAQSKSGLAVWGRYYATLAHEEQTKGNLEAAEVAALLGLSCQHAGDLRELLAQL